MLCRKRCPIARQVIQSLVIAAQHHGTFNQFLRHARFGRVMQQLMRQDVQMRCVVTREWGRHKLCEADLTVKQPGAAYLGQGVVTILLRTRIRRQENLADAMVVP